MTVYDFTGIANGQPWPAPWTTKIDDLPGGGPTGIVDVQSESGRITANNSWGGSAHQAQAQADIDIAMAFRYSALSGSPDAGLAVRATYSGDQFSSCYRLDFDSAGMSLVREVSLTDTVLATSAAITAVTAIDYVSRLRVRTVGATVELDAKVWVEANPEPEWQIEHVDSSGSRITTAGQFAVHLVTQFAAGVSTMLVREVEVENPATFDYSAPVLTSTLDSSDYSVDLAWSGGASDVEIQRETWAGQGEPWL